MAKILLVEDDNNLGEIYRARLEAEGYDIVYAHDGEEALSLAPTEKPDLVISDVMMPKVSGFEMLDILRNTDGLKDMKVIMLTALGQTEDKVRADKLGADRYLVKSQVTLEDIISAVKALLDPESEQQSPAMPITDAVAPTPAPASPTLQTPVSAPPADPIPTPPAQVQPETSPVSPNIPDSSSQSDSQNPLQTTPAPASPVTSTAPATTTTSTMPQSTDLGPQNTAPTTSPEPSTTPDAPQTSTPGSEPYSVASTTEPTQNPAYTNESPASSNVPPSPVIDQSNTESSSASIPSVPEVDTQSSSDEAKDIESQINQFVQDQSSPETQPQTSPEANPLTGSSSPDSNNAASAGLGAPEQVSDNSSTDNNDSLIANAVDQLKTGVEPTSPVNDTEADSQPADSTNSEEAQETPTPKPTATNQSVVSPDPAQTNQPAPEQVSPTMATPPASIDSENDDSAQVAHKKIISPIVDPNPKPDINALLAKEEASQPPAPAQPIIGGQPTDAAQTTDQTQPSNPAHAPGNVFQPSSPGDDPSSMAL